ncbi:hypothetical protein CTA2_3172 [Colletotrichum tanaceti]|nr:hypothetical protein CTA2_3172 [Colletotrichum tanaceti]
MSPPRRRSARLASASTPKPKPKYTLASVAERDDTPPSSKVAESLNALAVPNHDPTTPSSSSNLKAPLSEMHPSKVHPTVAPPSATWLGFRDMKPSDKNADPQATPSKTTGVPESPFTFRVAQPASDTGLSSDAQQMMNELREEAARIKTELLAKPRGKSGRFSGAHMAEFKKMDSIEGHPSSFRAQPGRVTPLKSSLKRSQSKANLDDTPAQPKSGLKRSPSKPDLDDTPTHPKSSLKRLPSKVNLENTPSQPKPSLKRSPSKTNLDDTPTHPKSILKQPSKLNLGIPGTPSQQKSSLKRSPSKANLDDTDSSDSKKASFGSRPRARLFALIEPPSSVKRVRQRFEDDASTARPVSRDGSSLPRPKSSGTDAPAGLRSQPSLASLTSPASSSLARAAGSKMPLPGTLTKSASKPDLGSLVKSPSKPEIGSLRKSPSKPELGGLTKSATTNNLAAFEKTAELKRRVVSPGRFERVKSILRGGKGALDKTKSAIPKPASGVSQTPAPQVTEKAPQAVPFTTPRRKLFKRVDFTPDTDRTAIAAPNTVAHRAFASLNPLHKQEEVQYPSLDAMLGNVTHRKEDDGLYPDLSVGSPSEKVSGKVISNATEGNNELPPTIPGTFTFRSDHTIRFSSASPTSFGSSAGQASVRHVRTSLDMPGNFPTGNEFGSNKENRSPMQLLAGKPHGMPNKKRARAREEEGDLEENTAERAGKRRKAEPVPEGDALLAPRLTGATPRTVGKKTQGFRAIQSPSPAKRAVDIFLNSMGPHASIPFTCTFCYRPSDGPPHVLGHEARLTCSPCHAALIDLAICWVCGEIVYRGDDKLVYRGVPLLELFAENHDAGGEGGSSLITRVAGATGKGCMREVEVPPLCAACFLGTEGEDVLQKGLKRIDVADGGLSRARWDAGEGRAGQLRRAPAVGRENRAGDGSHDRAEEGLATPVTDSTIYVSINDPIGLPAFKPSPTKPIPSCADTGHVDIRNLNFGVGKFTYTDRPNNYTPPSRAPPLSWVSNEPLKRPSSRIAARLERSDRTNSSGYITPPETPSEQTMRYKTPPPQLRRVRPQSPLVTTYVSQRSAVRRTPPPQSSEYLERYNPIRSPSPRLRTRQPVMVALERASRGVDPGLSRETAGITDESRNSQEADQSTDRPVSDGADSPREMGRKKNIQALRKLFGGR